MKVKIFFLAYYKVLKFENLMFLNEPIANFLEPSRAREGIWWKSSNKFIVMIVVLNLSCRQLNFNYMLKIAVLKQIY